MKDQPKSKPKPMKPKKAWAWVLYSNGRITGVHLVSKWARNCVKPEERVQRVEVRPCQK